MLCLWCPVAPRDLYFNLTARNKQEQFQSMVLRIKSLVQTCNVSYIRHGPQGACEKDRHAFQSSSETFYNRHQGRSYIFWSV